MRALTRTLEIFARQEAWPAFETVLSMGRAALTSPRGTAQAWPVVREVWLKHPEREALREPAVQLARAALAGYPDPAALIRISEMERPSVTPEAALERLRRALKFPPGHYARHSNWGVGKIRDNDTENVLIDFPSRPMHRMSFATAENALDSLPPGDLRVRLAVDPAGVKTLAREDPVGLVALALATLRNREGATEDLRRALVPAVFPSSGWSGWWRAARNAAASDPRVDSRRAYQNVYRLPGADEDETEVDLPIWDVRKPALKSLAVLDTFLEHHPGELPRVLEEFSPRITALIGDRRRPREGRAAAALWLSRRGAPGAPPAEALVTADFDFNALSKSEQEDLLGRISEPDGLLAALGSRNVSIRRAAWDRLEEAGALDGALRRALAEAVDRPEAALHVLEEGLDREATGPGDPAWTARLLHGWLDLLERPPRATHGKRALALMKRGSDWARRLAAAPVPEAAQDPFTLKLKRWAGTDRVRYPLLEFLRDVNHGSIAEEVEGHRLRSAARLADRMSTGAEVPYDGALVVTRATLSRLEQERVRIGNELKTTIPAAIQKARELGDLRENAEYKAAKDKQANYAQRFSELETLLNKVRLIENLERKPGIALPGTQVKLVAEVPSGDEDTLDIWLLGEGDQDLGEGVVSYKAPVGQSVFGHAEGETVEVPRESGPRRYAIRSVTERLP